MNAGFEFERRVFRAVKQSLSPTLDPTAPGQWHVHFHKRYHSRDRGRDFTVDIAAEYILNGQPKPSIYWIWECKDYSDTVPVSEIEEFHSKLQQVGEDNTKGTLISSGPFQRSAIPYAVSKGIGVARLLSDSQIRWVTHLASRPVDPYDALSADSPIVQNARVVAIVAAAQTTFDTLADLVTAQMRLSTGMNQ